MFPLRSEVPRICSQEQAKVAAVSDLCMGHETSAGDHPSWTGYEMACAWHPQTIEASYNWEVPVYPHVNKSLKSIASIVFHR